MRCASATATPNRVDVNKIVRAVERCADDLTDVDPLRVATKTISGLYDGATTAELDRLSIQTAAELIGEEPQYSRLAARLLAGYIDKEVRGAGRRGASASRSRLGHAAGADRRPDCRASSPPTPRKLDDAIDPARRPAVRVLRPAHGLRPLPAAAPRPRGWCSRPRSTSCCGSPAACPTPPGEAIELYRLMSPAGLPAQLADAVQRRHPAHPAVVLLPGRLAARRAGLDLRALRPGRRSCRSSPAASASPGRRVRSRGSLIRGTNGHSNGIVPWLRPSTPASRRSTRAAGARARPASTWSPGTPTSRSSWSCATTPARRPGARTTSTWPTGSRTSSCAGSRPTATWSLFDPKEVPELPDLWGDGVRRRLPGGRGRGSVRAPGQGPRPVRADDAHPGADRQRLDDVQGRGQPRLQPDRRRPGGDACTCPTCAPRSWRSADAETAVCNLGSINLAATSTASGRASTGRAARHGPRPRWPFLDRVIDLNYYPTAAGGGGEPALAPGRAGRDGPAGRVLRAAAAVRLGRGPGAVHPDRRGDLADRAGDVGRPRRAARRAPGVPADPGGGRGDCTPTSGARRRRRPGAGPRCGPGSRRHGLRNSLLVAIAPTATIASIAGCYECIEPQVSNLFKRETLSGEFLQVNRSPGRELKALGLWTRADPRRDQAGRRLGPGHRRAAGRAAGAVPHRVGAAAAGADRPGRRAGAVHRPVAVAEPVHGARRPSASCPRCTATPGRPA